MPEYRELMAAYRDRTRLDATGAARLRAGLDAPHPAAHPRPLLAAAALAALALIGLWSGLDRPPPPLAGPLSSGPLTAEVGLSVDGVGAASGDARDVELRWQAGRLDVEVEPRQGVRLSVRTEEATLRVIGTGFEVQRDALGTTVAVRHGVVELRCAEGPARPLSASETSNCPPRSAAGRLGRVRALQDGGLGAGALLAEIDQALALPDASGDVAQELLAVRMEALLALNRLPEALALAEALSSVEGPRTLDAHRVAARLSLARPSGAACAAALPHLRALARDGQLGADAPWLDTCEKELPP